MSDGIADIFKPEIQLPFLTFVVPGFIVWITMQAILPRGPQKTSAVIFEILSYGFINAIIWTLLRRPPSSWTAWPTSFLDDVVFILMVLVSPIVVGRLYLEVLQWLVAKRQILPLEPTAWDWLFLRVAAAKGGPAVIITLRDGTKLGGAFVDGAYTALHPYERDLHLSEVWQLNEKTNFVKRMASSRGLYIDKSDILYMEFFDYQDVVEAAIRLEEQRKHNERETNQGDHNAEEAAGGCAGTEGPGQRADSDNL
jgi:hypothetical protein